MTDKPEPTTPAIQAIFDRYWKGTNYPVLGAKHCVEILLRRLAVAASMIERLGKQADINEQERLKAQARLDAAQELADNLESLWRRDKLDKTPLELIQAFKNVLNTKPPSPS